MIVGVKELHYDTIDRKAAGLRTMERDEEDRAAKRAGIDAASGNGPLPGRHPAFGRLFTAPTQGGKKLVEGMLSKGAAPPTHVAADELGPGDAVEYALVEKADEQRYTFGPIYMPGALDAHREYADTDVLQGALWDFFENGDKVLHKQHTDAPVGRIVELVSWPFEQRVELTNPGTGVAKTVTLPAGTTYAGTLWEPEAWPLVKSGKITGYSMGGTAVRMRDQSAEGLVKFS
jgi:hypothetical protein